MQIGLDTRAKQGVEGSSLWQERTDGAKESSKAAKSGFSENKKDDGLTNVGRYRESYGLESIERMSDMEYEAFMRATANMSPNEKIRAAQSLHLVAKSYEEAKKRQKEESGEIDEFYSSVKERSIFSKNPEMIEKGIFVMRQFDSREARSMASFLDRFKGALNSNPLNISA